MNEIRFSHGSSLYDTLRNSDIEFSTENIANLMVQKIIIDKAIELLRRDYRDAIGEGKTDGGMYIRSNVLYTDIYHRRGAELIDIICGTIKGESHYRCEDHISREDVFTKANYTIKYYDTEEYLNDTPEPTLDPLNLIISKVTMEYIAMATLTIISSLGELL